MNYWLLKSEPDTFSIDDLARARGQRTEWDGIRNYQVRNMIRDRIKTGDLAFFYHSNCRPPGIVGIVEVVRSAYPDPSAWNPRSPYFDPKSDPQQPRWLMFDVRLVKRFDRTISLKELRSEPRLAEMTLLKRGNRLSITPVDEKQWQLILALSRHTM